MLLESSNIPNITMRVQKKRLLAIVFLVGCCLFGLGLHNTVYNSSVIPKKVSLRVERLVEGSSKGIYEDKLFTDPTNGLAVQQGNGSNVCFYSFWLVCSFSGVHCKNGVLASYIRHVLAIDMSSTIKRKENRTN